MNIFKYKIKYSDVKITKSEIGASIGYNGENMPDYFLENTTDILMKFEEKAELVGGFRTFENIELNNKNIIVNKQKIRTSKIIAKALKNSERIAIFACSAGNYVDDLIKNYKNSNDMLNSYITDISASLLAEKCADYICKKIEEISMKGAMKITKRFSPGYCNWNVSDQKKIFSLLPDSFCGITVNDYSLMTPVKSVNGILGIGKNVKNENYYCNNCDKTDCLIFKKLIK